MPLEPLLSEAKATTWRVIRSCLNPAPIPTGFPRAHLLQVLPEDARNFHAEAVETETVSSSIPYINSDEWHVDERSFAIRARIDELLAAYGPGVYTVLVYGPVDGESTLILEYPIFYKTDIPATYDRW